MLSESAKKSLEKQHYSLVGQHSAVKVCGWTKNMINGLGGCYKLTFYGIMSNQCMQMTTSISCANRCTFCWRGYKAPVSKEWKWGVDNPVMILEDALKAHHKRLCGFKDSKKANQALYEKSLTVRHVALSLTGEPIMYPRINELLTQCHAEGISTFLVTNAQYPESIRDLAPVTQLYISLDAPTKELLKTVDVPLFPDYWERLHKSLEYMKEKTHRTTIRLTMIKGLNDVDEEKYAQLIKKANPDFLEIKGYMHVGESRERLSKEHMPTHEEVREWGQKIVSHLPEFKLMSEHVPSSVVLAAQKKFCIDNVWHTWIDFERFHELAVAQKPILTQDYMKKTPKVGLSQKTTAEYFALLVKRRKK
ncbi:MAG: 4-demethylwyosine synthase TYW1 [Candidatus Woesearchaeota archaeon]